jgi:hypothetical protein
MTAEVGSSKRNAPPRRKGGTRYPKHSLDQVLPWAQKLVSKTHLSPITQDVLFAGVIGATSSTGEIKASSLKQFGLLEGRSNAYTATDLAKAINRSPEDELGPHLKDAALSPIIFKQLYETFHGDSVAISKIRQRAIELKVHPDLASECVAKYAATLSMAKLGVSDGSSFAHIERGATDASLPHRHELAPENPDLTNEDEPTDDASSEETAPTSDISQDDRIAPRAVFQVNVNLDASLDTEKLERQLKLLKQYGAI